MKQICTFGASTYRISDLQLLRNADDDAAIAKLLAPCPVMRLEADEAMTESNQARLYIVLRGALSDLLSPATLTEMQTRTPQAEFVTVPGVGHAPMLDEPEALAAVERLLAKVA